MLKTNYWDYTATHSSNTAQSARWRKKKMKCGSTDDTAMAVRNKFLMSDYPLKVTSYIEHPKNIFKFKSKVFNDSWTVEPRQFDIFVK